MLKKSFFEDFQHEGSDVGPSAHTAVIRRGAGVVLLHFFSRLFISLSLCALLTLAAVGLMTLLYAPLRFVFWEFLSQFEIVRALLALLPV
jgi:hypothetical protein